MLKNQWSDAAFGFSSLNDRCPVLKGDDIIVIAAPDPPGASDVMRISDGGMGWGGAWDGLVQVWVECGAEWGLHGY
jgi:hypothetical protein